MYLHLLEAWGKHWTHQLYTEMDTKMWILDDSDCQVQSYLTFIINLLEKHTVWAVMLIDKTLSKK